MYVKKLCRLSAALLSGDLPLKSASRQTMGPASQGLQWRVPQGGVASGRGCIRGRVPGKGAPEGGCLRGGVPQREREEKGEGGSEKGEERESGGKWAVSFRGKQEKVHKTCSRHDRGVFFPLQTGGPEKGQGAAKRTCIAWRWARQLLSSKNCHSQKGREDPETQEEGAWNRETQVPGTGILEATVRRPLLREDA